MLRKGVSDKKFMKAFGYYLNFPNINFIISENAGFIVLTKQKVTIRNRIITEKIIAP